MKKYFYFVAQFFKNGIKRTTCGIQESDDGYFNLVNAIDDISDKNNVKNVVITFWAETNSIMFGKFGGHKE